MNAVVLRLWVNPFGSQASHFPYIAIGMATQRETLQRSGLSFFIENNPCGLCRHPYPRMEARTPPIASQTEGDIAVFQVFS